MPEERSREDLNGLRVRIPRHPAIYLMDLGKKRHIPNPQQYGDLFKDWEGIVEDINIDEITAGDPIPNTAILFKYYNGPAVYLLDGEPPNQIKRHVENPQVMKRYHFDWNKIHVLPPEINFEDGPPIKNPF